MNKICLSYVISFTKLAGQKKLITIKFDLIFLIFVQSKNAISINTYTLHNLQKSFFKCLCMGQISLITGSVRETFYYAHVTNSQFSTISKKKRTFVETQTFKKSI